MKVIYTLLFVGITSILYAQDVAKDTIDDDDTNIYIEDYRKRFNVKFDVSNDVISYRFPQEQVELKIKPNLNIKYAFVLSYKFASIRLGIRPRVSEEDKKNKGDSKSFRILFKLLFDNWSHYFEYNYDKGYYIENTEDFVSDISISSSDFRIQFPNLNTNIFSGSTTYRFNKNYSVRAIESQTEIQIKSAGSFMPGILYSFYSIKGTDKILFPEDNVIIRENYNDINGFNAILNAGYYYTFVFHKNWFANANLNPGLGMDFYKTTKHSPDGINENNYNDFFYSLQSGVGLGYNGSKFFFGANYANRISSEKSNADKIQLQVSKNSFHIYLGYRFKAPKSVQKSVDLIEEKIPILNDKNN